MPWSLISLCDAFLDSQGSVLHRAHSREPMFSFVKTYICVHYDFSRSTVLLERKLIQKDSKMLLKCSKNHPKRVQKVKLNIAW